MTPELPALKTCIIPHTTLARRLVTEISEGASEIASGPASYIRAAFFADRTEDWFLVRFGCYIADAVKSFIPHPLMFVRQALSPDDIGAKRRRRFRWALIASASVHSALIAYLFYLGFIAPFMGIEVVDKPYRQLEPEKLHGPLRYPPGMLRISVPKEVTDLDKVRELDRKRREERARLEKEKREREERERAEREKAEAEKKAAEEAAKAEANKPPSTQFGEINTAPIRDLVGNIYSLYQAGGLEAQDMKFTVQVSFKIERDGSLSNLNVTRKSGSTQIDRYAKEILWKIGESHALGPIANISSPTIQLDLTEDVARLSIVGFAPSPEEAQRLTTMLNSLFKFVSWTNKSKNPEVAELMALVKVKCVNKQIQADLTVSRERAATLMQKQFGKTSGASQ